MITIVNYVHSPVRLPRERRDTRENRGAHDGAGRACARGPVATMYERWPGRLPKTLSSLLSVDELFILTAARPVFRSPQTPPRC
eukprot:249653-Pleurochrysis_carterae.AAC.1